MSHTARITAMLGLASIAVAVSFLWPSDNTPPVEQLDVQALAGRVRSAGKVEASALATGWDSVCALGPYDKTFGPVCDAVIHDAYWCLVFRREETVVAVKQMSRIVDYGGQSGRSSCLDVSAAPALYASGPDKLILR